MNSIKQHEIIIPNPDEDDFIIPELPSGIKLTFILYSSWDDPFYMGLNAIEIFIKNGTRANVENIETNAEECIGELSSLLYCQNCRSTDPMGMWMCNYQKHNKKFSQTPINVTINLKQPETIAMIRVWNYCESRVHALRGVRRMQIELDDLIVFKGEISCAFSAETDYGKPLGDTILFTTNEEILNLIAENDVFLNENSPSNSPIGSISDQFSILNINDSENKHNFENDKKEEAHCEFGELESINRPITSYTISSNPSSPAIIPSISTQLFLKQNFLPSPISTTVLANSTSNNDSDLITTNYIGENLDRKYENVLKEFEQNLNDSNLGNAICGKVFHMELTANWGNTDFIGLTSIQFLGANSELIPMKNCTIRCYSNDTETSTSLEKLQDSVDSVSNLINGHNITTESEEMWVSSWDPNSPPTLSFHFAEEVYLTGVSIWNYNASPELSYAGVRCCQFYINGRPIVGTVLLRKAPGYLFFDYVQDVLFDRCHLFRPLSTRPNTSSIDAFIFQICLLSTWGDEFYIGLNGLEIYDRKNVQIELKLQNLAAFPESVNVLPGVDRDLRSSDKLIDGINDTKKSSHMWLTCQLPNRYARIFIIFDSPTYVSKFRIYNYRKTPERGVRHIAVSADDLIIFSGEIPQSTSEETGILDISLRDLL